MRKRDAHRRLLTLLCFAMGASMAFLAGCGALLPGQKRGPDAEQVAEAFDRIVPGMTRADDLPNLGFDASAADAEILSARDVARRLGTAAADPAVHACIGAGLYCTGFVFHRAPASGLLQRVSHASRRPADIVLLVMNGRVTHKVFADSPERGIAVARAF